MRVYTRWGMRPARNGACFWHLENMATDRNGTGWAKAGGEQ
eukprot:CAMPEP_0179431514 /NCGR_PEP_ID=MMETSP0799-20121207/16390_1 /TAXON_ID=46947 /ORGANISM="Geminigera cryophila, Strain CCMP2564" /LENGTH=40 /DNA_ID= /DNA_START= /DNA_END= /DNA_ORIENTATION=